MATALKQTTIENLAQSIADEDYRPLERLFLAVNARPPLVAWRPERAMLRSSVLVRLLEAWQRTLRPSAGLPPLAAAAALCRGQDRDWSMLLAPADPEGSADLPPLDRLVYAHYGAGIARHYGRDMTNRTMSSFPGHIGTFFAAVYEAVRLRGEPIFTEHEPPAAVMVRSWRRLVLPFAGTSGGVAGFLVGNIPESAVGTLLDVMYDPALVTDGDGVIRLANRAAVDMFGRGNETVLGSSLDEHLPGLTAMMQQVVEEVEGLGALGRHQLALGRGRRRRLLEVSIGGTRIAGQPLFVLVLRDVTERVQREQTLENIAFRDDLTGVLNRRGLHQRAMPEGRPGQQRARRREDCFGLAIVDLDAFKSLNDTYGHAAGDAVLTSVARRLAASLRGHDVVARWGGDEFVVMLHGSADPIDLATAVAKLIDVIRGPHLVNGKALAVSASVGAALYPRHGSSFDAVFAAADKALYMAKAAGGNRFQLAPGGRGGDG